MAYTEHQEQLITELKEAASTLSYYNAAEGNSYNNEHDRRQSARDRFSFAKTRCHAAGIDVDPILTHYLV